jgi:polyphosphate kinase
VPGNNNRTTPKGKNGLFMKAKIKLAKITIPKEESWMDFNGRVLEEAADGEVPLLERLKFLGIYSNNLDEFFRVRVATLNRLAKVPKKKAVGLIGYDPAKALKQVQQQVMQQRDRFDRIYRRLLRELARQGIFIVDEKHMTDMQARFVEEYFYSVVRPKLFPIMLGRGAEFPELKDRLVYLAVTLQRAGRNTKSDYALIELPTDILPRFILLPKSGKDIGIIMLDDVIRYNLNAIFYPFGYKRFTAHTIKLTRDAELDIDNDISESYLRKIHKSIQRRKEGRPVRLVYDERISPDLLGFFIKRLRLQKSDSVISGSRYHNFKDFINFPAVGQASLRYPELKPLSHKALSGQRSMLEAVSRQDILMHFPYQSFDRIIDLLREASIHPEVRTIKITLYRTAPNSSIVNTLMNAVKNGKSVFAVVELQARFDEEANIHWSTELQDAGAKVVFGIPGLKVHSKICLITCRKNGNTRQFAVVGTGNFNEDTARIYTDHFLLTADNKITQQVADVFEFLENNYKVAPFNRLIVSPFNTLQRFEQLIEKEIENSKKGREAWMLLKMNHIVDPRMITLLYRASRAGVKIRLIVRGMFSLEPGVPGKSENIEAIRLVDRYLEHARVMFFAHGGAEKCFISSGDWMPRNLDKRVEVACPIMDETLKQELRDILEIQWRDNSKARPFGNSGRSFRQNAGRMYRAQRDIYAYLRRKCR